jgi:hypothetical protein
MSSIDPRDEKMFPKLTAPEIVDTTEFETLGRNNPI